MLGQKLFETTIENFLTLQRILTHTSYHYRVIANNLANQILDCVIDYFNTIQKVRWVTIEEVNVIYKLIIFSNKIVLSGNSKMRIDKNLSFFKDWIEKEMSKVSTSALNKIEIFFDSTNLSIKTVNDIRSFLLVCKGDLDKLILYNGEISSTYFTLSNTLINRTLTCLIDRLAEMERSPMNRKIDLEIKYGLLLDQGIGIFNELNKIHKSPQTQQRLDKYIGIFKDKLKVFNEPLSKGSPDNKSPNSENKTTNPENRTTTKAEPTPPVENSPNVAKNSTFKKWLNFNFLNRKKIQSGNPSKDSNNINEHIKYVIIAAVIFFALLAYLVRVTDSELSHKVEADINTSKDVTSDTKSSQGISTVTRIEPENSKWIGNKLSNGSTPYSNIWGHGVFDPNSDCYVVFKNGNNTDAIVCLENVNNGSIIRNSYIQAGTNYKMKKLPVGSYKIKVFYGNDWNPGKMINNGVIKGGFENNIHFSISERESDWLKVFYDSKTYSYGEITLYTVNDGNMQQRGIDSDEFFK
jgi:hypothetical protein